MAKRDDIETEVELNTKFRLEMQEKERRAAWVQRKCIAVGMALSTIIYKIGGWAFDNFPALRAAIEAYQKAKNGQ
ncbi:hypothetical protein UFOVP191_55 [uncultured Caudovirales phage]|uniref:Uncharacterized protein n=1 Tax=uncultured Caudovirales phage TaxID=2100421 RepID=A0A6J7WJ52_9CAUD|nr:hypothetical protein UFOVP191_55 [uncultured Caudovirales phage]